MGNVLSAEEYRFFEEEIDKIKILNELSNQYNLSVEKNLLVGQINQSNSIGELLIITCSILDSLRERILINVENVVPVHQNGVTPFYKQNVELEESDFYFSGILSVTSEIMKYLMFYKKMKLSTKSCRYIPSSTRLTNNREIIEATMEQAIVNYFISYWIYSDIGYFQRDDGIFFYVTDNDELNDFFNLKNERTHLFTNIMQTELIENEISEVLDLTIENNKKNLAKVYHIDNFETEIESIELENWVKAFAIIQKECKIFNYTNRKKIKRTVKDYCLIKSRNQWKQIFLKNNFTKEQTEKIFTFFIFDIKSEDLFDCPFIEVEDTKELLVMPNIVLGTYASGAVMSNFISKFADEVSFRGYGFEKNVNDMLKNEGIKVTTLNQNVRGESYECDSCFLIDTTLYFVECKSHAEPQSFERTIKNISKLIEETDQLNRITNHFKNEQNYILNKLGLEKNTKIKDVKKILLSATDLGQSLYINDVYITDYSTFSNFFLRNRLVLKNALGEVLARNYQEEYEGEITSLKFDEVLKNIFFGKNLQKHKKEKIFHLNKHPTFKFILSQIDFATIMISKNSSSVEVMKNYLGVKK